MSRFDRYFRSFRLESHLAAATHWRIGRKVLFSYGAVAVAIAVLALVAAGSLLLTRGTVSNVTDLADSARAIAKANGTALAAQGQIKTYVIAPTDAAIARVRNSFDALKEQIADAEDGVELVGKTEALGRVERLGKELWRQFDIIVKAQTELAGVTKSLHGKGPEIGQILHDIVVGAHNAGNNLAAYRAALALEQYSELRINVNLYLSAPSNAAVKDAKTDLLELEEALNGIYDATTDKTLSRKVDRVILALVEYDGTFDKVVTLTTQRERAVDNILAKTGPAFEQSANEVAEAIASRQGRAGLAAQAAAIGAISVTLLAAAAGLAVALFAGVLTNQLIATPIVRMAEAMLALARGETDTRVSGETRKDEVGDMARAVAVFKANAAEVDERRKAAIAQEHREREREAAAAAEREAERQRAEKEKQAALHAMAASFEETVQHVVNSVLSAAKQIAAGAAQVSGAVRQSSELVVTVAASAEEASHNALTVANASEEMARSITEVTSQVLESSSISTQAAARARGTDAIVANLSKDAETIGEIVGLIDSIAEQTNLLALNATIEAARAGVAGRGFAVVASEIKALANQTTEATVAINNRVSAIQEVTRETVGAIREIVGNIGAVSDICANVAAAVEQQAVTTAEIARNTQQASDGTHAVSRHIEQMRGGVEATDAAARDSLSAATELSRQAETLNLEVERFLGRVRAA
jgi:methyl-accepting chemotaxis protein